MPSFPIIDTHVHLYDPVAIRFPWMSSVPQLNRPHGLSEFSRLTQGVTVDGLVFIEVDAGDGQHLEEARWVEAHGRDDARLRGVVASMPLEQGPAAVEADLAAFATLPHARGVRRLIQSHADEAGWALRAPFVAAVQSLAAHNLTFDLCIRHGQLAEATELVRRCPQIRFVLDHIGKPGIEAGLLEPWKTQMRALAAEPNVLCKISGVVTEADHKFWTYDQVAPYVAHAIECFGFGRVMFGGDWPVSELATRYVRWVDTVDRVTAGSSEADLRSLYRDTAVAFYRL
jgi:L-fuconolactonase